MAGPTRSAPEKGYDPAYGARPLGRVIEEEIKRPLTEEILFGCLAAGGRVTVESEGGTVSEAPA